MSTCLFPTPSSIYMQRLSWEEQEAGSGPRELKDETRGQANDSLTNQKPSAIYRLRPHLPPDAPLPTSTPTPAANLGIEIAPLPQLEQLLSTIGGGTEGKGKEVAGKVDVGKVAEKVVKNVRFSILAPSLLSSFLARAYLLFVVCGSAWGEEGSWW